METKIIYLFVVVIFYFSRSVLSCIYIKIVEKCAASFARQNTQNSKREAGEDALNKRARQVMRCVKKTHDISLILLFSVSNHWCIPRF